jgi:hypothetical protein
MKALGKAPVVSFNEKNYPKVCLCGSTKFKEEFLYWAKFFTLNGVIVTMPMVFAHSGDKITDEQKRELDDLHKAKILDSQAIFVVNVNGYIGESTKSEIEFAKSLGIRIMYLEEVEE